MVIKGFKSIIFLKGTVIIYVINLQYILITRVVNIYYKCYNYKIQDRRSGALFLLFFHLPLGLLFLLNLFLKLK